jgi:hypothetical protein
LFPLGCTARIHRRPQTKTLTIKQLIKCKHKVLTLYIASKERTSSLCVLNIVKHRPQPHSRPPPHFTITPPSIAQIFRFFPHLLQWTSVFPSTHSIPVHILGQFRINLDQPASISDAKAASETRSQTAYAASAAHQTCLTNNNAEQVGYKLRWAR